MCSVDSKSLASLVFWAKAWTATSRAGAWTLSSAIDCRDSSCLTILSWIFVLMTDNSSLPKMSAGPGDAPRPEVRSGDWKRV